jgi:hypothetical protein
VVESGFRQRRVFGVGPQGQSVPFASSADNARLAQVWEQKIGRRLLVDLEVIKKVRICEDGSRRKESSGIFHGEMIVCFVSLSIIHFYLLPFIPVSFRSIH